jgi:dihydrodipicolinate synthase/N-acetylneuraminate lyase
MPTTALEKLAQLKAKYEADCVALKSEAISDIAKRLSEAKALVVDLENQYYDLTGKTVKGEKGKRIRLTPEQKDELIAKVEQVIKSAKKPISMSDIIKQAGASASAVREAVSKSKDVKKTGEKAGTLYSAK